MGFKPGENTRDRISQLQEVSFVKDQFIEDVFNTDYVLVKERDFERAAQALTAAGYEVRP